jgi:hypothetical protein
VQSKNKFRTFNKQSLHCEFLQSIMSFTLFDSRKSRSISPNTVADRIALFETMRHTSITGTTHNRTSSIKANKAITTTPQQQRPKKERLADGNPFELFLEAIGHETKTSIASPRLRRIATEWWQTVHINQEKQHQEDTPATLSKSLHLMTASLDPKCATLEVLALEELLFLEQERHPSMTFPLDENDPVLVVPKKKVSFSMLMDTTSTQSSPMTFLRTPFTYRMVVEPDYNDDDDHEIMRHLQLITIESSPRSDMFYYR